MQTKLVTVLVTKRTSKRDTLATRVYTLHPHNDQLSYLPSPSFKENGKTLQKDVNKCK